MKKPNTVITSILVVTLLSVFFLYKYQSLKTENLSLRLKMKLLEKNKKKSLSWSELKEKETTPKVAEKIEIPTKVTKEKKSSQTSIQEMSLGQLTNQLQEDLRSHWTLKPQDIDRDISLADELITRNPNVYSSYKAKLILLLTKENIQEGVNEDNEIEYLLDAMSEFDVVSNMALQKEAFLISKTNSQIETLLDEIDALDINLSLLEESEAESAEDVQALMAKKIEELEVLENQLEQGVLGDKDVLNEDIVDIPLYRALAREDYDRVIAESEALLSDFPKSVRGHLFLIRALELSGREDESLYFIENSELDEPALDELKARLDESRSESPKNYWKRLRF